VVANQRNFLLALLDRIVPSWKLEVRPIKDDEYLNGHSLKERCEPAKNERKEENKNEGQSLLPCVDTGLGHEQ
jgi:hypothetical protein